MRLNYPKVRWARGPLPKPILLGRVWNTASFESLAEEGDAAHLEPRVSEWLAQNGWRRLADVRTGIQQRQADVKNALEGAPHLFRSVTGEDAVKVGARSKQAKLWGLAEWSIPGEEEAQERLDGLDARDESQDGGEDSEGLPATQDEEFPF